MAWGAANIGPKKAGDPRRPSLLCGMAMRGSAPMQGHLKAFIATLFWGCSFIAMRHALDHATPHAVVWMRNLVGAAFLYGLLRWRGDALLPARADRWRVLVLGLIFGMHLWIQAVALGTTTTMRAGWIIAFVPVVVAVGGWLFQGRGLKALGWLGIGIASTGVMVLTAVRPTELSAAAPGDLLMLASTVTWAAYTLLGRSPAQRSGALRTTAGALMVSAVLNLATGLGGPVWTAPPDAVAWTALLFLGLGASGLALWLFTDAAAELGAERASAFQYGQPFITMLAAWAMLREPLSNDLLVAGPLVLAGVWLVQRNGRTAPGAMRS
jgi:drug/metabolite transporter (DMT)-like permease